MNRTLAFLGTDPCTATGLYAKYFWPLVTVTLLVGIGLFIRLAIKRKHAWLTIPILLIGLPLVGYITLVLLIVGTCRN